MIGDTFLPVSNLTSTVSAAASDSEIEAEAAFLLEPSTGQNFNEPKMEIKKLGYCASMTKMNFRVPLFLKALKKVI